MYLKTTILVACFAVSYVLLVFVAQSWLQALGLAILLGLSAAGIGFNTQHDGGHRAYSSYFWVNKLMATTLDVLGGSSYLWHWKHAVFHHSYVNIAGHDTDINLGMFARLTPHQKRFMFHRWQHLYSGHCMDCWQSSGNFLMIFESSSLGGSANIESLALRSGTSSFSWSVKRSSSPRRSAFRCCFTARASSSSITWWPRWCL